MIFLWTYQKNMNCVYLNHFFQLYPPIDWLVGSSLPSKFSPDIIEAVLTDLTPQNVRWVGLHIDNYIFWTIVYANGYMHYSASRWFQNPILTISFWLCFSNQAFYYVHWMTLEVQCSSPDSGGFNFNYCCIEVRFSWLLMKTIVLCHGLGFGSIHGFDMTRTRYSWGIHFGQDHSLLGTPSGNIEKVKKQNDCEWQAKRSAYAIVFPPFSFGRAEQDGKC